LVAGLDCSLCEEDDGELLVISQDCLVYWDGSLLDTASDFASLLPSSISFPHAEDLFASIGWLSNPDG
jgi:hypothetical protein